MGQKPLQNLVKLPTEITRAKVIFSHFGEWKLRKFLLQDALTSKTWKARALKTKN